MLIAQITDLHVRVAGQLAYRRVDTNALLARAVAHLNALDPRPDLVVATGDLVDLGRPEEYAVLRRLLDGLAMPYRLLPGNHDDRAALRSVFPDHAYLFQDGTHLHWVERLDGWRLIALDSLEPGRERGLLCRARLEWLAGRLAEDSAPALLFLHHPPFLPGMAYHDASPLEGRDAFGDLLRRHGDRVRWIGCGHLHRNVETRFAGISATAVSATCHQAALTLAPEAALAFTLEPPACRLILPNADGEVVSHVSLIGDFKGPYPFFEDGRLIT